MFYFVRHGKSDYSERNTKIYQGFAVNLAPLSEKGVRQIKKTAKDSRLSGADLILCSPYTRAVQSAAILSKELGIDIQIETELHEWIADSSYQPVSDEEEDKAYELYIMSGGKHASAEDKWEEKDAVRSRILGVLEKYKDLSKVIVIGHGTMIDAVTGCGHIKCGSIVEFNYN